MFPQRPLIPLAMEAFDSFSGLCPLVGVSFFSPKRKPLSSLVPQFRFFFFYQRVFFLRRVQHTLKSFFPFSDVPPLVLSFRIRIPLRSSMRTRSLLEQAFFCRLSSPSQLPSLFQPLVHIPPLSRWCCISSSSVWCAAWLQLE